MRKINAEVTIVGNGGAAMLAASRLSALGYQTALVNPLPDFDIDDIRPYRVLSLWDAAYRLAFDQTLPQLYDQLIERMKETFPAALDQSGLAKTEHWSMLSSTPIHRAVTEKFEKEFFRLERKSWSAGQFRLVNPESVLARTRRLGLDLTQVGQIEGAIVRAYALWWDAPRVGFHLSQFIRNKFGTSFVFEGAAIRKKQGRRFIIVTREGEEACVEAERAVLVFLTGRLLPQMKSIVSSCGEPWIQGVRKRRREQHFAWFERHKPLGSPLIPRSVDESLSLELGQTRYRWSKDGGTATWLSAKGPDGFERVIDEGLRLHCLPAADSRFTRAVRAFRLEWDWKNPQWRQTSHETYWGTSFEGDLFSILELLWNLPFH